MLFWQITQEADRRSAGIVRPAAGTFNYANRNYRTAAGGEDEFVPDFDAARRWIAERAGADARGHGASAGRAGGEARGGVQAEENHLRDDRIRGHRRHAEGPREEFGVARAAARGRRARARGAAVRESRGAA